MQISRATSAFDAQGETNPTKSDIRYYNQLKMWNNNGSIDFSFVDSHQKNYTVKDTSKENTRIARINDRLNQSKHIVVILSSNTRNVGSRLSYEIERAVEHNELPLIITYADYKNKIPKPTSLTRYFPGALLSALSNRNAKAIHIPFNINAISSALGEFNINNNPNGSYIYYTNYTS